MPRAFQVATRVQRLAGRSVVFPDLMEPRTLRWTASSRRARPVALLVAWMAGSVANRNRLGRALDSLVMNFSSTGWPA